MPSSTPGSGTPDGRRLRSRRFWTNRSRPCGLWLDAARRLRRNPARHGRPRPVRRVFVVVAIGAPILAPYSPTKAASSVVDHFQLPGRPHCWARTSRAATCCRASCRGRGQSLWVAVLSVSVGPVARPASRRDQRAHSPAAVGRLLDDAAGRHRPVVPGLLLDDQDRPLLGPGLNTDRAAIAVENVADLRPDPAREHAGAEESDFSLAARSIGASRAEDPPAAHAAQRPHAA